MHERQHEPVASYQEHRGHLARVAAAVVAPAAAAAQMEPAAVAAAAAAAVAAAAAAAAASAAARGCTGEFSTKKKSKLFFSKCYVVDMVCLMNTHIL